MSIRVVEVISHVSGPPESLALCQLAHAFAGLCDWTAAVVQFAIGQLRLDLMGVLFPYSQMCSEGLPLLHTLIILPVPVRLFRSPLPLSPSLLPNSYLMRTASSFRVLRLDLAAAALGSSS